MKGETKPTHTIQYGDLPAHIFDSGWKIKTGKSISKSQCCLAPVLEKHISMGGYGNSHWKCQKCNQFCNIIYQPKS